jgi:hypothetical protein
MAAKITHLQSPADSKSYDVPKSHGQPRVSASGHSPAQFEKSYGYVSASGEPPTAAAGVAPADSRKYSATPNTKSRR